MPVPKKKPITSKSEPSMLEPLSLVLPDQQAFHCYLRTLTQGAMRTVMREEGDGFSAQSH
jgi:hypothetical protein